MKQYRDHLLVCAGTGCVSSESFKIKEALEKEIARRGLGDEVQVVATGCNGFCERGPIVMVQPDGIFYQLLKTEDVPWLVEEHLLKGRPVKKLMYVPPADDKPVPKMKDIPFFKNQRLIVLRNRGRIDPEKIDEYIAFDGYEALGKALTKMTPEAILAEVSASGLRGRGGGGFPTGQKWEVCAKDKRTPKYIICNGDEGDPGAFMDRSVIEADPHAVLEGMAIGGQAIGGRHGFIYIRHEYPLAIKRIEIAIGQAREYGLLGEDILGTGFSISTSRSSRAPARSSAAKKRPSSPPSRARSPCPASGRPTRPEGPLGIADGHQQRRDLGDRPQHRPPRRGLVLGAGDRHEQGDEDLLARRQDRQHRPGRGPHGHHPAGRSSSASAAASPAGGPSRPSRSAGRRAAASRPSCSTCRSTTRA